MGASKSRARRFSVPEVWRTIVKKNERQGSELFDVLVCNHAVPSNDNTYRKARSCPACRQRVQEYADTLKARAPSAPTPGARRGPVQREKADPL